MGTSAKIVVEGNAQICVYKHFDGYPDGTLPWLEKFNEEFTNNRGIDPIYKLAQLLRSSVRDCKAYDLDPSEFTGWGCCLSREIDANYTYILKKDGSVKVKK